MSHSNFQRTVLVANQKGGAGKSSIVSGVGSAVAGTGRRVLIVDADQQGNVSASDLGIKGDLGRSLAMALQFGQPLEPLREVRPNLDLVCGGAALAGLGTALVIGKQAGLDQSAHLFDTVGALIDREGYDLVLIDSGPGDAAVIDHFLKFARWLLVPTKDDDASMSGVEMLAARYLRARQEAASVELLGVVLFDANPRATARNREALEQVTDLLEGSGADVFKTIIRTDRAAAVDLRAHHMTPIDLVTAAEHHQKRRLEKLREKAGLVERTLWSRDPSGLATDYQNLTREVLTTLAERERDAQVEEVS